jgi:hypothetical protein
VKKMAVSAQYGFAILRRSFAKRKTPYLAWQEMVMSVMRERERERAREREQEPCQVDGIYAKFFVFPGNFSTGPDGRQFHILL